jgi:DNA repair exonuclease SbcCD ATPase subunit
MPAPSEHTHHIKIRSTQMEMPTRAGAAPAEDYDYKLKAAQDELERIQIQREELERKKRELEELTVRKRSFLSQQVELAEKLTSAVTLIERELYEIRQETEDLEQCRVCFASHLDKLEKINPEAWPRDNLSEKLDRATMAVDIAADEYDQAAVHFEGSRRGAIFGRASKRGRTRTRSATHSEFMNHLRNGLAFNLPLCVLGGTALIIYLLK